VELSDGQTVTAAAVVSAVPWYELTRLLPSPLLREELFFASVLDLTPAPIISINLWFDQPITELDFVGLRGTTTQWLFSRKRLPAAGAYPILLVLSGAHAHIGCSKEELRKLALEELSLFFPLVQKARLLRFLVVKERRATFSPRPGTESLRPVARTPIKAFYLAGDWTATGLPATIEGAVQSGYRAAQEIIGRS